MGPPPWPCGAAIRPVSSFFSTAPFIPRCFLKLLAVSLRMLLSTVCASQSVYVNREVRRLISFLYLILSLLS